MTWLLSWVGAFELTGVYGRRYERFPNRLMKVIPMSDRVLFFLFPLQAVVVFHLQTKWPLFCRDTLRRDTLEGVGVGIFGTKSSSGNNAVIIEIIYAMALHLNLWLM